jgi:hypothetical protein
VAVDRGDLELLWPRDLFASEGQELIQSGSVTEANLGLLMDEAFVGDVGQRMIGQLADADPWGTHQASTLSTLLVGLVRDVDQIPMYTRPIYYAERKGPRPPRKLLDFNGLVTEVSRVVRELDTAGYFESAFGSSCVDGDNDHPAQGQRILSDLLDTDAAVWPVPDFVLDEDLFYSEIEALHDVVARPRSRRWHSYGHEWDYSDFSRASGQRVYIWKINAVLERGETSLRLSNAGPDRGRLVETTGDPRDELIERVLAVPVARDRSDVEHAVELFRRRGSSRDDKRSSVVALARVLENYRKDVLAPRLLSRDESALFQIANQFDIRHRNADQHGEYADEFLDWIFWWYLGTIELVHRLLVRPTPSPPTA